MTVSQSSNLLLRSLSKETFASFDAEFEEVELPQSIVLCERGDKVKHVYFPESGLVSLFAITAGAEPVETAVIGSEGIVGSLAVAEVSSFTRALVQIPGTALRIGTEAFLRLYSGSPALRSMIVRFNSALIAQIQQNVACNILHDVKERTCRWLLHAADRIGDVTLPITQEAIAQSITAHRATVIAAISSLEADEMIRHRRGRIEILDGDALRRSSCECYQHVFRRYAELIGTK